MPTKTRAVQQSPLTVEEVARLRGIPADQVLPGVRTAEIPAPTRWTAGVQPRWSREAATGTPVDTMAVGAVTPAMHLEELLDELSNYVLDHGHARPLQSDVGRTRHGRTFPLGVRVSAIRTQKRRGKLSKEAISRFEALPGWTWDKQTTEWVEKFQDVVSRFPYHLTKQDRGWLSVQRRRWDDLPPEWQDMFNEVPGLLDTAPRQRIKELRAAIEQWMQLNPGKDASDIGFFETVRIDGKDFAVGKRITYYRRRYTGKEGVNALSAEEVELLESVPGWEWVSRRHPAERARRKGADS